MEKKKINICVCGGRGVTDRQYVYDCLDSIKHLYWNAEVTLHTGACKGADELAEDLQYVTRFRPGDGVVRTTLRLVYRHPERSLTQEEVNTAQDELRKKLAESLGVAFA